MEAVCRRQLEVALYCDTGSSTAGSDERYVGSVYVDLGQLLARGCGTTAGSSGGPHSNSGVHDTSGRGGRERGAQGSGIRSSSTSSSAVRGPALRDHWVVNPSLPCMLGARVSVGATWRSLGVKPREQTSSPSRRGKVTASAAAAAAGAAFGGSFMHDGEEEDDDVMAVRASPGDGDSSNPDEYVFTVDRAVQLPLMCETSERSKRTSAPNALVTFRIGGAVEALRTPVVQSSTRPRWGWRHSVKLPPTFDFTRPIVFKVAPFHIARLFFNHKRYYYYHYHYHYLYHHEKHRHHSLDHQHFHLHQNHHHPHHHYHHHHHHHCYYRSGIDRLMAHAVARVVRTS